MLKIIFPLLLATCFCGGSLLFVALNIYSNYILIPKMRIKGIIDTHEAVWYFLWSTPIPALRDYLENNQDEELSAIYGKLHMLSKLVAWLVGGSLTLAIVGNAIESIM